MTEQQAFRHGHPIRVRASIALSLTAGLLAFLLTGFRPEAAPPAPAERSVVPELVELPDEFGVPDPPREVLRPDRDLALADPKPIAVEIEASAPDPVDEPADGPERIDPGALGNAPFVVFDDPPRIRRMVTPEYPSIARAAGIEGWVLCAIHLDAEGRVTEVRIIDSSSSLFHDAARSALLESTFSPARQSDQPVACVVQQRIRFELRERR